MYQSTRTSRKVRQGILLSVRTGSYESLSDHGLHEALLSSKGTSGFRLGHADHALSYIELIRVARRPRRPGLAPAKDRLARKGSGRGEVGRHRLPTAGPGIRRRAALPTLEAWKVRGLTN